MSWSEKLQNRLARIDETSEGEIGVFVKDLATGEELSFRGEESWYVASGVKVPIALETLKQIETGCFDLETEIELGEDDFVDGAGETNSHVPGTRLSVRYLIEQMLIHSDNTASDLLIQRAGLENVNRLMAQVTAGEFGEITRLADVRRHAFSGFHSAAFQLANRDFLTLKALPRENEKIQKLADLLKLDRKEFKRKTLDAAFEEFYGKRFNSATLRVYARLLEDVIGGRILNETSTAWLLDVLTKVETGQKRIKATWPRNLIFAHKTGTQHARVCDFGVAWDSTAQEPRQRVVIASCARGFRTLEAAETALASVGRAIQGSGVFRESLSVAGVFE